MASIVTITTATETVHCDANGHGVHVFNISNTSGVPIRVGTQVLVEGPTQDQWLHMEGPSERDLDEKGADQLSVRIEAPKGTAPGRYKFRLLVFSVKNPGEDFSESPTVAFEIPKPKKDEPKPKVVKPSFPWWIPAVVVGVLVVGGLIWWIFSGEEQLVEVPDLRTKTLIQALQILDEKGLGYGGATPQENADKPDQTVLDQTPKPHDKVAQGKEVHLVVSTKPGKPLQFSVQQIHILKQMKAYKTFQPALQRMVKPEEEKP